MSQSIASFIPHFWSPHLEIDLEIIAGHLDAGDSVRVYVCNQELPSCYGNLVHKTDVCNWCVNRRRNGIRALGLNGKVEIENFLNIASDDLDTFKRFRGIHVESLEQLLSYSIDDFAVGRAIYNEICSHICDTELDFNEHRQYLTSALESGAAVYLSFKNHFRRWRPDCFYTFNGRFVVAKAAIAAARAAEIPFALHDRAWRLNYFSLVRNESLHSLDYWQKLAESTWDNSTEPEEEKIRIATEWFEERIAGANASSYTSDQDIPLPDSFARTRTNIVIFNSSEYETVGLEDYRMPVYGSQSEAIQRIAAAFAGHTNLQFYLRVHPNLKGRDNVQVRTIRDEITGRFPNLEVIPAESRISTYNLMKNADAVITFGSTTGIEAAYLGSPSILLGPAMYGRLNACFVPTSHDDLIELITQRKYVLSEDERARRKMHALKFAYFGLRNGESFKYFEQVADNEMRVKSTGEWISGEPQEGASGLLQELEDRVEVRLGAYPNQLSGTLAEAVLLAVSAFEENKQLRALLEQQKQNSPAGARLASSMHSITSLGRSFKHRLKRFL